MALSTRNVVAGGNILPYHFVKLSTSANNTVVVAGSNDIVFGVSKVGQKYAPTAANTNYYAAESGDGIEVYGPGETCMLVAGTGGWTAGDFLKSDTNGAGVTITATGTTAQNIGARALETVSAGEYGRVEIYLETKVYPALS